jgi:hypothetical protein
MSVLYEGFPVAVGVFIDVQHAVTLIKRKPRRTHTVLVGPLRELIKTNYVAINKKHAETGPIQQTPLLMMEVAGRWCVIDGWHRVYQAHRWGRKTLKAYRLTAKEAKLCAWPMLKWIKVTKKLSKKKRSAKRRCLKRNGS